MANSEVPEYLQYHGSSKGTGKLFIENGGMNASIYLLDGELVHAEDDTHSGMVSVYKALSWGEVKASWQPAVLSPSIQFHHSVDEVLFQYAQLEDSGQTDEASLISMFGQSAAGDVKLMELSQYTISFEVLNTSFKGFVFTLEGDETLIGRLEDCDVILPDGSCSGHHCKIVMEKACIRVVDLGSTNGTFINNKLISESLLQVGDGFQIGGVQVAMNLKMKRSVAAAAEQPSAPAPVVPHYTQKLDPKVLRKKTSKVTGPITWKNISDDSKKTGNQSFFGKMFGRK